jgi:hypothetical protein
MITLPTEIVDIIADFHDYDKYCKPIHKKDYELVMIDIEDINNTFRNMKPSVVKKFWGNSWDNLMEDSEEDLYDEIYFVGTTFDMYDGYDN